MEHRKALHRNLAQSLFEHGQVKTTVSKAKDLRPFCERLISMALRVRQRQASGDAAGALTARRCLQKMLGDRSLIPKEHQEAYDGMSDAARERTMRMSSGRRHRTGEPRGRLAFTAESVTHRLVEKIAPQFEGRPGGFTRMIRLADRRIGDASFLAIVQLVGDEEGPGPLTRSAKTARRKRADARYAMAIKMAKSRKASQKTADVASAEPSESVESDSVSEPAPEQASSDE